MLNFKHLYFADDDLDIADVLTTIGIHILIGGTEIKWAHDFGDLGGEPEGLDCTPLSAHVTMEKAGLTEQENWTVDYYYNAEDYDNIDALKNADESSDIEVQFDNGEKFTNKGIVRANYLSGGGVNAVADAHCVIELSNADGWQHENG